jgi:hypothetical protein
MFRSGYTLQASAAATTGWPLAHGQRKDAKGESISSATPPLRELVELASKYSRILILEDSDLADNAQALAGFMHLKRIWQMKTAGVGGFVKSPSLGLLAHNP